MLLSVKNILPSRFVYLLATIATALLGTSSFAQNQTYLNATGTPTFGILAPVENGFLNIANGNLHLEFDLGTFPQRGKKQFTAKLIYESRIWQIDPNSNSWQPTNVPNSQAGWRFATTVDPGVVTQVLTSTSCGANQFIQTWQAFIWTDPMGTQRAFPITTIQNQCTGANTTSGDAYAQDSSGFHMYVTNFTSATIFAKDGTQVYPSVKDTNGNFFTTDANGNVIDTLNRTPVTKTVNGNTTSYNVLNSQGSTSTFSVTTRRSTSALHSANQASPNIPGRLRPFRGLTCPMAPATASTMTPEPLPVFTA